MPRFAANVTTMFPELPIAERFCAARQAGFAAVGSLFHYAEYAEYAEPVGRIKQWLDNADIEMILLNTPLGHGQLGERGLAAVPGRQTDFRRDFERALGYAAPLGVAMTHVMAGVVDDAARMEAEAVLVDNVRRAADLARTHDIRIPLEPLNVEDTPGCFLTRTAQTRRVINAVGRDNVYLQYDFYHRRIMEGNLARQLAENLDVIGHVRFSSVPGRHEPQYGEVNLPYLFAECARLGCEYRPKTTTREGFGWGARP